MANWLSAQLEAMPNHSILLALATDERMSAVYADLRKWSPGALSLIALVVHFSTPTILSNLQKPSEERWSLSWPEYRLGAVAGEFATMLEWWPNAARELWGEPVDALVECLRAFAIAAFERAKAKQSVYDDIPEPNRRGRGSPKQLAFREALSRLLHPLSESDPLSKERQDRIIATLTSIVFPGSPVDTETIRRHRQRRGKIVGDN